MTTTLLGAAGALSYPLEAPVERGAADPIPHAISVVVASNRDRALLDACLESLVPQCSDARAELIVARAADNGGRELEALRACYPGVIVVGVGPGAGIPELRGTGMAAAHGRVVALTEDHCLPAADWVARMASHADDGADVVGGGMDNARQRRAVDWGAYFSEYGFFDAHRTRDTAAGGVPLLTGANVAYARAVTADVAAWMRSGDWENVVHARLAARGCTLRFDAAARVAQNRSYGFAAFCRDRYEHGRDYARTRLAEERRGTAARAAMLATIPALPLLLTSRVARAAARVRPRAFLRALPATFAFLTAWSVGEAIGYLRGPAR